MPGILFAAIDAPTPLPQRMMPRSARSFAHGLADRRGEVRIVHRRPCCGCPRRAPRCSRATRKRLDGLLQLEAGMIRSRSRCAWFTSSRATSALAAATTFSGVKPNFFCSSCERRRGAERLHPDALTPRPRHNEPTRAWSPFRRTPAPSPTQAAPVRDIRDARGSALEQLPRRHADDARVDALGLQLLDAPRRRATLRCQWPAGSRRAPVAGVREHVGAALHARRQRRISCDRTSAPPGGSESARPVDGAAGMITRQASTSLVGVGRAQGDEPGDRAQRRELLDRLVRRAVFADADRVVREDVDDRNLHQRAQADRRRGSSH